MVLLVAGIVVFLTTFTVFWRSLPVESRKYRLADTPWEAYFGVAITAGAALGFALILSGVFELMGRPA
jgi:hypothetical protein